MWSLERFRGVFGAPFERPRTRNAYRTVGFSLISNSIFFTFGPGRPWSDRGASLERPWCALERFRAQNAAPASSDELRRAPRNSQVKRSVGAAAAAREYEGDPQLHSVHAKYFGTPCPVRGGRIVNASRYRPTPFRDPRLRH